MMRQASSRLSLALAAVVALLVAIDNGCAFTLPRSHVASTKRTRGLVQAVQSMPPPTTTSSSSAAGGEKGPWSPESWRKFTPRQMPVYDDQVRSYIHLCTIKIREALVGGCSSLGVARLSVCSHLLTLYIHPRIYNETQAELEKVEEALAKSSPLVFAGECRQLHEHLGK